MDARIEKAMNFENLGARSTENEALDKNIWALEAFKGKTVFSGRSREILEFFELLEGLGTKDRGSYKIWGFFLDFCGILEGLE
jgi:hypothetical protein